MTKKLSKNIALGLVLLLCSFCCVGCNGADHGTELTKVTLNEVAHSIFYAPMYVAIEEGYFEDEGIEIELITGFGAVH